MPSDRMERVLGPDFVAELDELPMEELRARRSQCQEVEVGLSYGRRMIQGRLDIVHAEIGRRSAGAGPTAASALVERLEKGEMLGDQARPAGWGRLTTVFAPSPEDQELPAELEEAAGDVDLANLPEFSDAEVRDLADRLTELERELSHRRRQVLDRIDACQAEIVRRYKSGAANPEDLLA
ncbi:MAG TPA: hypothetical protein VFO65_07390 [Acidimicrobiales bacterium]|nr:hypothetical protein [Acidimicrobiales bacterium]